MLETDSSVFCAEILIHYSAIFAGGDAKFGFAHRPPV